MTGRLPSTFREALAGEVQTCLGRVRWDDEHPPTTQLMRRYQKQHQAALVAARQQLALFDAGILPRMMPGASAHVLLRSVTGLPLCRWCGTECPTKHRTFCSPECVHEWKLRSDAGYARDQVWQRDAGQCATCPAVVGRKRGPWEMDHTIPVVEGGGSCGLENLRTLCRPCHRVVTAALAGRRAAAKRAPAPAA